MPKKNSEFDFRGNLKMKVLVVEDEVRLAEALQQLLIKDRYDTDIVHNGVAGLDNALTGIYDVIVLDIMLPKMNGLDVLKSVREAGITTPVLLLTAKDEVKDKVTGLDCGADDYLTKPFNSDELLARVRALTRRRNQVATDNTISYEDITLNLSTYELQSYSSTQANSIKLGLKEFRIMEYLINNGSRIVSKEDMIEKIWGYDSDAEYNNVEVYISFLRKKLSYLGASVNIKTIRGAGYSLGVNDNA